MDKNIKLLEELKKLSEYYKNNNDIWRYRSYQIAISKLKLLKDRIKSIDQVSNIKGIGSGIKDKISEFLKNGLISKINDINNKQEILILFQNIWGVGPKKAEKLYEAGFREISELKKDTSLLTTQQKIGLKYYNDLLKPLKHNFINKLKEHINDIIVSSKLHPSSYILEFAGSYRRGKKESSDVDIIISSDKFDLNYLVNILKDNDVILDILSMQNEKFMGIAKFKNKKFRLDIEFLPKNEFPFGLLYFTGSCDFNIQMRAFVKSKGMTLNQHGLFLNNKPIKCKSEKDIFNYLNLEYVDPKNRG
jgi:DNA polymerase beta